MDEPPVDEPLVDDPLVATLLDLLAEPAVTGSEAALATRLATRLAPHGVTRVGDSLVVGAPSGERACVALVGHLDVVPPTDADATPRVEDRPDGAVVVGRGASDMHGGNAVLLRLLEDGTAAASDLDVVGVLYAREEGPAADNELADVLEQVPWLSDLDGAIVLEPTDGQLQAGCLGGLHARLTFHGRQAHSARPWHGRNALTMAGPLLRALDDLVPEPVEVDGLRFHDVYSATQATTYSARNVIPDVFILNLNYRFSPSSTAEQAAQRLIERVAGWIDPLTLRAHGLHGGSHSDPSEPRPEVDGGWCELEVTDVAPPARPTLDAPLLQRLRDRAGVAVTAKQAWTDVARFAALGVPAVNLGPGRTDQAHQRGEWVAVDALHAVHGHLATFLRP